MNKKSQKRASLVTILYNVNLVIFGPIHGDSKKTLFLCFLGQPVNNVKKSCLSFLKINTSFLFYNVISRYLLNCGRSFSWITLYINYEYNNIVISRYINVKIWTEVYYCLEMYWPECRCLENTEIHTKVKFILDSILFWFSDLLFSQKLKGILNFFFKQYNLKGYLCFKHNQKQKISKIQQYWIYYDH